MKLIDLYKKWMKRGIIVVPSYIIPNGLCYEIPIEYSDSWELFRPSEKEIKQLQRDGFCPTYWASGLPKDSDGENSDFTPLRQTIVLLICAMHNEI